MATRVDSWIWGIRLTKTRSAAGAACRAGHVQVNGVTAKPATTVAIGDEVRVRLHGRERIVDVVQLISKRASAPVAAECYIDRSPPPPPKEMLAAVPRRDRGAGRPTKRERRQLDRLRGGGLLLAAAALVLTLSACGGDEPIESPAPTRTPKAGTGPLFPRCGGLTTQEVTAATTFAGLKLYVDNPSVCEWRQSDVRSGAVASFNWYRGSPIGRERGLEQLTREEQTVDYETAGYPGFLARHPSVCEVGVQFENDFIEISIADRPVIAGQRTVSQETLCSAAKQLAATSIERAS
ncbi:hypothetical protein GOHSU_08_00610 [Gordonia hirsuta DSM 44140 = NBRC 16056]|uniref:RNA-binding S4 domain-containing protein n=1 Tax=Gordonia hirsuta DSM 44140 = NBRC 16056 TaxID=1121927 RepID=L7L941_9ACTN|nr:DUF3558 family protein [Gordonia hirsuta]GAC56533.1 hypothetical protein GOHSU_08_00610 [Gordonia hirsuta DSM 44140 = NBRC 16056]